MSTTMLFVKKNLLITNNKIIGEKCLADRIVFYSTVCCFYHNALKITENLRVMRAIHLT